MAQYQVSATRLDIDLGGGRTLARGETATFDLLPGEVTMLYAWPGAVLVPVPDAEIVADEAAIASDKEVLAEAQSKLETDQAAEAVKGKAPS